MNKEEIFSTIVKLIEEELEEESLEITEESSFLDDLELSSFECLSLVGSVEEKLGIKFSNKEVNAMSTVGEMVEVSLSK